MLYHPEVFIYLMLAPLVCLVILPALLSTMRMVIGVLKTSKVSETHEENSLETVAGV